MALFQPLKVETGFFEPEALSIALYVRDRLGIEPVSGGAPGSRAAPAVAIDGHLAGESLDAVSAQWASWWTTLFGAAVLRGTPSPIDYYGPLVREPDLGRTAEPLLRDAIAWVTTQKARTRDEWGDPTSPTFRPSVVRDLVRNARPRVRGPQSIRFLVLPIADRTGWRIGPSFFGVSKPLLHDLAAFTEWFAGQIPQGL